MEQADRLSELGSDELQGYLFARPAAPADLNLDGMVPEQHEPARRPSSDV